MSNNWETYVRKVEPYVPGEQTKDPQMIKLNTNENPYGPSPKAVCALQNMDMSRLRLYPDPKMDDVIEAYAKVNRVEKEQVFAGIGSDDVLAMIFLTFFQSDKPVIFPDITYSFYDVWADLFRIPYETIPLDENLKIRAKDYERENGGIIIANPNAPTGELLPLAQIEGIVKANPDSIVVVDEAYVDFGGETALPLISKYDNVLVVSTFSKSRALAGIRVGFACGDKKLIQYLNDVKFSFNSYTLNAPAIVVAKEALLDVEYFEEIRNKVMATRERVKPIFKELGFRVGDSQSNFLFVTHKTAKATDIMAHLRENHILVRHFKKPEKIENYLRITIGTDEQMDRLIEVLRAYL